MNEACQAPRIAIVAGEASGDLLGAGLIDAVRQRAPAAGFAGVCGPRMAATGCECWLDAEALAVMGLSEVVRHLPRLIAERRRLATRALAWRPDVFVGIDAPDFNLGLEIRLRRAGLRTVHYVSPSVWAWREGRVRKIARAADIVLCLLPFEKAFYDRHGVAAVYVGHPLADRLPLESPQRPAREALGLDASATVVAVLPGSRGTEVAALGDDFAAAIAELARRRPALRFVVPLAGARVGDAFRRALSVHARDVEVRLVDGRSHEAMAAADVVLLASGTAALEAALIKRPMVVAYRVSATTRRILTAFRLLRVDRFALPNLLAGEDLVPELMQDAVTPGALADRVEALLDDSAHRAELVTRFTEMHETLRCGASTRAADAVLSLAAEAGR